MRVLPLKNRMFWWIVLFKILLIMLFFSACNSVPKNTSDTSIEPSLNTEQSNDALIWKRYTGEIDNPDIPKLFDYSYAGYKLGEQGIPEKFDQLKVFNVADYGAIPNDGISDQDAIQSAINAAELNKGGIVFFPPGEFLVNVKPTEALAITVSSSNIILKGSGWGKNGTTVNMVDHMLQSYPDQPEWQVNYMFKFFSKQGEGKQTPITKNAYEGAFTIEVEDIENFKNAKFIQLEMAPNLDAVKDALEGKPARPHWERIIEKGVTYVENHEIKSISGHKITLKDPLINAINTNYNWVAKPFYPLENVGVEDIFFKANFNDKFVHHKDFLHDNAWSHGLMSKNIWYEESINVPFIIRWPERLKAGQKSDLLISPTDIMPTILNMMGATNGMPSNLDGKDLSNIILENKGDEPQSVMYYFIEEGQPASGHRGLRTKRYTYVVTLDRNDQERQILYDNKEDPYQLKNIVTSATDVKNELHQELLQQLKSKKDPWLERYEILNQNK